MAFCSLAVNAAISLGDRPAGIQRTLRTRRIAQPTSGQRMRVILAASQSSDGSAGFDESPGDRNRRRRRRQDNENNNNKNAHHRSPGRVPTPRTPGDLHRRAAAAAARDAMNKPQGGGGVGGGGGDHNPNGAPSAFSAPSSSTSPDGGNVELPGYPGYPGGDSSASNAVSPMARGVCWSNLQDLDTVPDDTSVYILVFGHGTGSEGLYSLQERTKEDVPVDIILAFPSHEDAARYGTLLEAEMGRIPVVEAARPRDLRFTCREGGYRCKVARQGALLMPPEKTVEVTDWERTNALRKGQWSVQLEESNGTDVLNVTAEGGPEGCQVVGFAGVSGEGVVMDDSSSCAGPDDDEDGETNEEEENDVNLQYDDKSAREMLSRMFNWGPNLGESE